MPNHSNDRPGRPGGSRSPLSVKLMFSSTAGASASVDDGKSASLLGSPYDSLISRITELHRPFAQEDGRFEATLFVFLVSHLLIQNFNIYKLNFYHYNLHLILLTKFILLKRILLKYCTVTGTGPKGFHGLECTPLVWLNWTIIAIVFFNSVYLAAQLFAKHPLYNFMFLVYPVVGYMIFWGVAPRTRADGVRELTGRLSGIVWSSLECGYFAGVLPLGFLQHEYLSFDLLRCTLVIVYLCVNSFVLFIANLLATSFTEIRFQSQNLGCWRLYTPQGGAAENGGRSTGSGEHDRSKPVTWDVKHGPYDRGTVVKYNCRHYIALGEKNEVRPGRWLAWIVFVLFENPHRTHTGLILTQAAVVLSQLLILLNSRHWTVYGVMLAFSYFILYQCILARRTNLPFFETGRRRAASSKSKVTL